MGRRAAEGEAVKLAEFMSVFTVYRLFDEEGNLLYVGCTNNVGRRLSEHARSPFVLLATDIFTTAYPDRESALKAETEAIRNEHPRFNQVGLGDHKKAARRRARKEMIDYYGGREAFEEISAALEKMSEEIP